MIISFIVYEELCPISLHASINQPYKWVVETKLNNFIWGFFWGGGGLVGRAGGPCTLLIRMIYRLGFCFGITKF